VSGELLAKALREHGHQRVHFVQDKEDLPHFLHKMVLPGDVVIAQGAGDINKSIRELGQRLEAEGEEEAR
jgi:UDP-N-acetylmuramate--alanine ligase